MSGKSEGRGRLEAVDWLRGIAALWVLCYHSNIAVQKAKYFAAPSFGHWAEAGHRGVDLFFILSGFIMAATVPVSAKLDYRGARNFAIRRAMRIFPGYLAVFVGLVLAFTFTGLGALHPGYLLWNLFLLPRDDITTYVPVVAWTLSHELMFYVLFTTAYLKRGLAIGLLILWSVLCLSANATGTIPSGWRMQLSLFNLYFLVGVGATYLRPHVRGRWLPLALVSLVAIVGAVLLDRDGAAKVDLSVHTALYMVGFAGLILAMAESGLINTRLWHRPFQVLGRQSYSLYLVHYPVVIVVAMTMTRIGFRERWVLLPVSAALALFASWVIFSLVEKPGIGLGRRLTSKAKPEPAFETAASSPLRHG